MGRELAAIYGTACHPIFHGDFPPFESVDGADKQLAFICCGAGDGFAISPHQPEAPCQRPQHMGSQEGTS